MINTMKSIFTFAAAMVANILLLGCATGMSHGSKTDNARVASQQSEDHTFINVLVRHTKNGDVLRGTLKHEHKFSETDVHVDIAVVDSSGEIQFQTSVPVNADRVRGRYRDAKFKVRLPKTLETSNTIKIAFHSSPPDRRPKIKCDGNKAVAMTSVKNGEKP